MAAVADSDEHRLGLAYERYAREPRRVSLPVAAAARALEVSRARFYAYWETADDLGLDVAYRRATSDRGWQAQVMADERPDVFEAIGAALQSPGASSGATVRAVLAGGASGAAGRERIQAWEGRWLDWLADRLRRAVDGDADRPWTVAAATVTALGEGALLLRGSRLTGRVQPLDTRFAGLVASTATRVAARFRDHVAGPDVSLLAGEALWQPALEGADRLLDRVIEAIDAGHLSAGHSGEVRVVNTQALASELGVSTRWIHECWPTAEDFNAALFGEALRRLSAVTDEAAMRAFSSASITDPSQAGPVLVSINEALMDLDAHQEPLVVLSLLDLLDHADIGGHHRELIERWCATNEMKAAAILHAMGRLLRSPVGLPDYADLAIGTGLGGWRLCAAHPELRAQRCTYLGDDVATMAAGLDCITQVLIEAPDAPGGRPT